MAKEFIYVMKGVRKLYGTKEVFKDIWLSFYPGAKIGVLGPNGAGKSTLLKIMAGVDREFDGEAWAAEGTKIGYLPQEPQLDPALTVFENVMLALKDKKAVLDKFNQISNAFAEPDADMDALLAEQAELQERIDAENLWDSGARG